MLHIPRQRRLFALALVGATDIGFIILPIEGFDAANVALFFGMILAVAVSFLVSAFSHLIRVERVLYKYVISGVVGIFVGAIVFFVLRQLDLLSMEWVNTVGKGVLILLNLIAGLFLFFVKSDPRKDQ